MLIAELLDGKINHIQIEGNNLSRDIPHASTDTPICLILDYKAYFDLNYRKRIIPRDMEPTWLISPTEAIAGYIKSKDESVAGSIVILDIVLEECHVSTIGFEEGQYFWKERASNPNTMPINDLLKQYLNVSVAQIKDLEAFLMKKDAEGTTYAETIQAAFKEYQNGQKEYEEVFAILDTPDFAHIKLSDLITFREELVRRTKTDLQNPFIVTGVFGVLISEGIIEECGLEKIRGAAYIQKHEQSFYPKIEESIALELYAYPDLIKVPVYEKHSTFETYTIPKSIEIIDTGVVTLFRGERACQIKTNNNMKNVHLEICLDRNQNVLVTVDSTTYIVV
jgi:hypothetical protein